LTHPEHSAAVGNDSPARLLAIIFSAVPFMEELNSGSVGQGALNPSFTKPRARLARRNPIKVKNQDYAKVF
jgi:hypothetical protein